MNRIVVAVVIIMGMGTVVRTYAQQVRENISIPRSEVKKVETLTNEDIALLRTNDLVKKVPDVSKVQQQKVFHAFLRFSNSRVHIPENKNGAPTAPNIIEELRPILSTEQLKRYTEANKAEFIQKINGLRKKQ